MGRHVYILFEWVGMSYLRMRAAQWIINNDDLTTANTDPPKYTGHCLALCMHICIVLYGTRWPFRFNTCDRLGAPEMLRHGRSCSPHVVGWSGVIYLVIHVVSSYITYWAQSQIVMRCDFIYTYMVDEWRRKRKYIKFNKYKIANIMSNMYIEWDLNLNINKWRNKNRILWKYKENRFYLYTVVSVRKI